MSKFPKQERLNSRKRIAYLVNQGHTLYAYPFRIRWCMGDSPDAALHLEAAFSVPKRKHKKATRRNRIKRKMREAFRLNKEGFRERCGLRAHTLSLLVIYTPRKDEAYATMEKGMQEAFRLLENKLKTQTQ